MVNQLYLAATCIGGVVILLALLSDGLKSRLWLLSSPLIATVAGVVFGPTLLGWLLPRQWPDPNHLLLELARVSVAMAVMSIALRIPRRFWRQQASLMALVLTAGMAAMWLATSALGWWLLPINAATALLLGAVLTPTDPVIAGSITTGSAARKLVPLRIRHALAAESGANDGAAYAFVTLPVLTATSGWGGYVVDGLLHGIVLAVIAGAALGAGVGALQRLAERAGWPGSETLPAVSIALALMTLGTLKLLGSDGVLGVFAAGIAFNVVVSRAGPEEREQESRQEHVQELVNHLISWPAFILFGALLPWPHWEAHWHLLLPLAAAVLLLRRPPWFYPLLSFSNATRATADRLFLSWYGPIGMAAIFYSMHAYAQGHHEVWWFASFVVVSSVVIHGMSATPGTRWYGRQVGGADRQANDDQAPAGE